MKKKKLIIISLVTIICLIIVSWASGVIPKQIARINGINYINKNFPKMKLEYVNVEWNKYYGDYVITFKSNDNKKYSFLIGPKYLPITAGQGIVAIEEEYDKNYK